MRKHSWGIVLPQKEIPDIVCDAFPGIPLPSTWVDSTYLLEVITYDPITDAQVALLTATPLSAYGLCSLLCTSEEVQEAHHPEKTTEAFFDEMYLYTFTLRGHIAVRERQGEEVAYGWTKTALKELALNPPAPLSEKVEDFQVSDVQLYLEAENNRHEDGSLAPGDTSTLYTFVDAVLSDQGEPIISRFETADGFLVDWSCPRYGEDRSSIDWFEIFYQGQSLAQEVMYHTLDEEAVQRLADGIALGKTAMEIPGRVF